MYDHHDPEYMLGVPRFQNDPRGKLTIEDVKNILGEPTGMTWKDRDQTVTFQAGVLEIKKSNGLITKVSTLEALEQNELERLLS